MSILPRWPQLFTIGYSSRTDLPTGVAVSCVMHVLILPIPHTGNQI